jgi:hypothetical protein
MKELGELALCAHNLPCDEEINEVGLVGAGIGEDLSTLENLRS